MKKIILFSLFALLSTLFMQAQSDKSSPFSIKGQVIDSITNETVPYATLSISLSQSPQKAEKLLACDIDGKFEAEMKVPGTYIITMQSLGKVTSKTSFTLSEEKKKLDLGKLFMMEDNKRLGEVTVTAQKPLVKVEVDKITYNLDEDPEAVTSNTLEMLRKVPMVTVDGEDKIQLKGSTNFKIYMNGKPSNLISNNPGDVLKSMPANSVKNIEVITEPGAKYDAEGVGGIINIITKSSMQGYTGTVRANANTLGSVGGGAYVSAKVGKLGITGNFNYNYRNSPYNDFNSYRENFTSKEMKYLTQDGRSKNKGPMQYGYLELSYEIDTLNLLSLSANRFNGKSNNISETDEIMRNEGLETIYQFRRNSNSRNTFGGTEVNLDFQHSTSRKDELLTFSYKFNNSPGGSTNNTDINSLVNYADRTERTTNDASTNEHTAQMDYTRPLNKNQSIEIGAKYILRQSDSETERFLNDTLSRDANASFKHTQHIYSGYAGYNLKWNKFAFKTGLRAEGTSLNVESDNAFDASYFNVVPSATLSYQLNMSQSLRLGYNMRIQRPGIWYLNPYVNTTDPLNISYGNTDLDAEKSNNITLNYSMFTQKININASVNYSFVNNGIEQYTFIDPEKPGITQSTYDNIGKNQNVGAFLYGSWNPISTFRIYMNGGIDYTNMKSDNWGNNSGYNYRVFTGIQYTLPKDFRINLNGGYFAPRIMLQGKSSAFYFTGITLNKDFLKKKLTVSLSAQDPFWKTKEMKSTTEDANFYRKSVNRMSARSFSLSVSWRFGDLKSAIKKVKRGISNDDQKSGGEGQSTEGGGA